MVKMLPIKDFPGYYISKTGDVWSDKTNPIYAKTKKLHKIIRTASRRKVNESRGAYS